MKSSTVFTHLVGLSMQAWGMILTEPTPDTALHSVVTEGWKNHNNNPNQTPIEEDRYSYKLAPLGEFEKTVIQVQRSRGPLFEERDIDDLLDELKSFGPTDQFIILDAGSMQAEGENHVSSELSQVRHAFGFQMANQIAHEQKKDVKIRAFGDSYTVQDMDILGSNPNVEVRASSPEPGDMPSGSRNKETAIVYAPSRLSHIESLPPQNAYIVNMYHSDAPMKPEHADFYSSLLKDDQLETINSIASEIRLKYLILPENLVHLQKEYIPIMRLGGDVGKLEELENIVLWGRKDLYMTSIKNLKKTLKRLKVLGRD